MGMPAQPTPQDEAWICPFCQKNDTDFLPEKLQFHCGRCHALGKHLSFVKQVLAKNAFTNLNTVLAGPTIPHAVAHCPECRKPLSFFPINTKDRKNVIAACLPCRWVWSDAVDFLHAFANTAPGHIERAEIKVLNRERESAVDGDFHDRLDGQGGHTTRYVEGTMNNVLGPHQPARRFPYRLQQL